MNKKGLFSTVISVILLTLLLILVLSLIIIGPKALITKVADGAVSLLDSTLSFVRGTDIEKPKDTAVEVNQNVRNSFYDIIGKLRSQGNGPCILNYQKFNDIKGHTIKLEQTNDGTSAQLFNKKGQVVDKPVTISSKKPCVIGEGATQNFYDSFLKGKPCNKNCGNSYYKIVNIVIDDTGTIKVNDKRINLDDGSILFKAEDSNVCFFPTVNRWFQKCHAENDGLDDDCIKEIKNKLPQCQ